MAEEATPVVMSFTDVIRFNLSRLRKYDPAGKRSRRGVATSVRRWTGDPSWNEWLLYDIEGRKGRDRVISPEELLTLAITYQVSLIELMSPPNTVNVGTDDEPDIRPVKVRVGPDDLSPVLFDRAAFHFPANWRVEAGRHDMPKPIEKLSAKNAQEVGTDFDAAARRVLPPEAIDQDDSVDWEEWIPWLMAGPGREAFNEALDEGIGAGVRRMLIGEGEEE